MSICGIDVSEFQGNIDWEKVRKAGIQFAILRAGYGAGTIDLQFRKNAEGCSRVGIPFGAYWFSYACTPEMARQEAECCGETIEEFALSYPVGIQYDRASVRYAKSRGMAVTGETATAIVEAFCGRIRELGYTPMFYAGPDYLEQYFDPYLREKYLLWQARHTGRPEPDRGGIWQYRDDGRVEGITAETGMNLADW